MNSERLFPVPVEPCWILDSSAIIEFKSIIAPEIQGQILGFLDQWVLHGKIAFPRQVIDEVSGDGQDDMPANWVSQNSRNLVHPKLPEGKYLTRVFNKVPDLVERKSTKDPADPFVLALALQLNDKDRNSIVVTEDRIDRLPKKRSLICACEIMGVEAIRAEPFIEYVSYENLG